MHILPTPWLLRAKLRPERHVGIQGILARWISQPRISVPERGTRRFYGQHVCRCCCPLPNSLSTSLRLFEIHLTHEEAISVLNAARISFPFWT